MKVHFIAVGGAVMHSLAIALARAGHQVTGSDDEIFEPSRSRLQAEGILPEPGWNPEKITPELDAVILGMHAFEDNPELARARELNLPVFSFPEFIYNQSLHKQRIVVAGSYGKTTVTAMIMHAFSRAGLDFDYVVGAQVPGFDNPVRLSERAPMILIEGDEYFASRQDPRPKFLFYKPHSVVLTGIEWDHINVYPTQEAYEAAFEQLLSGLDKAADIIFQDSDPVLHRLVKEFTDTDIHYLYPFVLPPYKVRDENFQVKLGGEWGSLRIAGAHNMANLAAAWQVCELTGIEAADFLRYMADFVGAGLRMQTLHNSPNLAIIRDYAHAPAKVRSTVQAVKEWRSRKNLIAVFELHTFSSLDKRYLHYYKHALKLADKRILMVDPHALEKRRLPELTDDFLRDAFGDKKLVVVHNSAELLQELNAGRKGNDVMLLMSSGPLGGLNWEDLTKN